MFYINHDLKALFIQMPKCGGTYIRDILIKYYNFKEFEIEKRDDIFDFFDKEEHLINSIEYYKGDVVTIRKLGLLRYIINNEDNNTAQNMTEEKWDSYYKFTFVRNPYERLVSSFEMFKRISKKLPDEDSNNYSSFQNFIEKKNDIGNISFFHSFIKQYDHLLDYNEKLNINFIGEFSSLDTDLVVVLKQLGIQDMIHLDVIDDHYPKLYERRYREFYNHYDNKILKLINNLFLEDFKCFKYKKFNNIKKMKTYYENQKENKNDSLIEMYKHYKIVKINESAALLNLFEVKKELFTFLSNIKTIYNIESNNLFINTSVNKFNNLINSQVTCFKKKNLADFLDNAFCFIEKKIKEFNGELSKKKCMCCNNFFYFNDRSIFLHKHSCK